jgi:hypothetical protein
MKLNITTLLVEKVKNYTQINAAELTGGGSNKALFIAEEALSELLMGWHKKNLRDAWKEDNFTDNFYFISAKNAVKNVITREDRIKRNVWKDAGNLSLNRDLDGDIAFELEDDSPEELLHTIENDAEVNKQLQFIVETLENSKYINDFDVEVFLKCYMEGQFIKNFVAENGVSYKKVSNSKAKIRNVLNYLYKG